MVQWVRKYGWVVVALIGVFFIGILGRQVASERSAPNSSSHPAEVASNPVDPGSSLGKKMAPNFTLTDQFGKTVSLKQYRGKVVVLAFVDSKCTTICPLTTQSMVRAVQMLGPKAAAHVQLVGVDANPTFTSVADVRRFSVLHGLMHSWVFLTGSSQQLKSVWSHYYVYVAVEHHVVDHTPAVYVIDSKGRERRIFLTSTHFNVVGAQASVLAATIAKYLPHSVLPSHIPHIGYKPTNYSPSSSVTLTRLTAHGASGSLTLRPNQDRLTVFLASWAPAAYQQMQGLNSVAKALPHVKIVGVDVGSVEPSRNAIIPLLRRVGRLQYPIVLDPAGNLAQAYGVTNIPWMALTNAHGRVIWTHSGWLASPKILTHALSTTLKATHSGS